MNYLVIAVWLFLKPVDIEHLKPKAHRASKKGVKELANCRSVKVNSRESEREREREKK